MKTHLLIKGRIPSKKNSKQIIRTARGFSLISSNAYLEWEQQGRWQIKCQRPPRREECKIELVFFAPDKRKSDLTNKAESIMDLLVTCGVIPDDNWFVCKNVSLIFGGVDRQDPRCEILICEP